MYTHFLGGCIWFAVKDIHLLSTEVAKHRSEKMWLYKLFSYVGEPRETSQSKQDVHESQLFFLSALW